MSAHHQGSPSGTHSVTSDPDHPAEGSRHQPAHSKPHGALAFTSSRSGDVSHLSTLVRICITGVLLIVCAVLAESTVDAIPDDPLVGVFTPLRLLVIAGIALALAARPELWAVRTRLDILLLLLLGWAAASVALFDGLGSAWRNLFTGIAVYYLVVLARRCGGQPMDLAIFGAATLAVVSSSLVGLMQTVNEIPTGFCRSLLDTANESCQDPDTIVRAMGTTTNPNLLAALILLVGPLAGWVTSRITDYYLRILAWACTGVVALALIFTVSRIAIFAALVSFGVFFILRNPTRGRLLAGAVTGVLVVSGWAIAVLAGGGLGLRSDLYIASYRIMRDHLWGVGIGNAGETLQAYVPNTLPFAHAHNLWLNWLIELGPIGALLWVAIAVVVLLHVTKAAQAGSAQAPYIGAALTAFFIASLFDHAANTSRIAYLMWFVLAVAASLPTTIAQVRGLDDGFRFEDRPRGGELVDQYRRADRGIGHTGHLAGATEHYLHDEDSDEPAHLSIRLPNAEATVSAGRGRAATAPATVVSLTEREKVSVRAPGRDSSSARSTSPWHSRPQRAGASHPAQPGGTAASATHSHKESSPTGAGSQAADRDHASWVQAAERDKVTTKGRNMATPAPSARRPTVASETGGPAVPSVSTSAAKDAAAAVQRGAARLGSAPDPNEAEHRDQLPARNKPRP